MALLPWLSVIHLSGNISESNKRIAALEKQVKEQDDAVLIAAGAVQYTAKVERNLDDFQVYQSQQTDDLWKAFSYLQKMCKRKK